MPFRSRHGLTIAALFVALATRSLIPLGYMPGNLLAGEYMVLCPSGGGAMFLDDAAAHRHSAHTAHDSNAPHEQVAGVDERCPIGSVLLSGIATAYADTSHEIPPVRYLCAGVPSAPALRSRASSHSSRGPPAPANRFS